MRSVRLRPQARRDLAEAKRLYAKQGPSLAEQLRLHLKPRFSRIVEFPEIFARAPIGNARRAPAVGPFPYSVYYRERGEVIEVLAILHNARHPDEWRRRAQ